MAASSYTTYEYIVKVLLPKCNVLSVGVKSGEFAAYGSYKFVKHGTKQEIYIDGIVDEVLQEYTQTKSYLYDISDMEIKLNLWVSKYNNHNKNQKLDLEQLKIFLVTINTNILLHFIQILKNFNIPTWSAMQLWIIVNDILNDSVITHASSDENWPPSLCSGINQDDVSDDDDAAINDAADDDIYEESSDNTQYIHNEETTFLTSNRILNIIPQIQYNKWDVNISTAGDLYYNRCLLPLRMQQLHIQMNDNQLQLDIIIIKHIFQQAFKLYILCMLSSLYTDFDK